MEQITRERWLSALLSMDGGGRLNPLLSVMSGGKIQFVTWLEPVSFAASDAAAQNDALQQLLAEAQITGQWPAQPLQWQGAGLLHSQNGEQGLLVAAAFAAPEDFQQSQLEQALRWLRQMQQHNSFPVRLLLLAFCQAPDTAQAQPDLLPTWQWEEILETGLQLATGQQSALEEVLVLPLAAYPRWLQEA